VLGLVQTLSVGFDVSLADLIGRLGIAVGPGSPFYAVLKITLAQTAPVLPFLLMVVMLIVRPKGLMGTRET
jgi:branched-chain amino acid transport system permease protein